MKKEIIESMLEKAKTSKDPIMAECWILTARTMGDCYEIEGAAYQIYCDTKNVSSAAELLQKMYVDYSNEPRFWDEVTKLIESVKNDSTDEVGTFYKCVFQNLLPAMQQTLLLEMAERQKDKMEQCRYLLLLFKLFPESDGQFGVQLIDLLSDLEKTATQSQVHESVYAQLLVYEITPMLLKSNLALSESKCIQLLKQCIHFYVSLALSGSAKNNHLSANQQDQSIRSSSGKNSERHDNLLDSDSDFLYSGDPWENIFRCFSLIAEKCDWKTGKMLKAFKLEPIRQLLKMMNDSASLNSPEISTLALIIFLYMAYEKYANNNLNAGQTALAFVPLDLIDSDFAGAGQSESSAPPPKKSKLDVAAGVKISSIDDRLGEIYEISIFCAGILGSSLASSIFAVFPADRFVWLNDFLLDHSLALSLDNDQISDWSPEMGVAQATRVIGYWIRNENWENALNVAIKCLKDVKLWNEKSPDELKLLLDPQNGHFSILNDDYFAYYVVAVVFYCLRQKIDRSTTLAPSNSSIDSVTSHSQHQSIVDDANLGNLLILSQFFTFYLQNDSFTSFYLKCLARRRNFTYPNLLSNLLDARILEELAYLNAHDESLTLRIIDFDYRGLNSESYRDTVRSELENQMMASLDLSCIEVIRRFIEQKEALILHSA